MKATALVSLGVFLLVVTSVSGDAIFHKQTQNKIDTVLTELSALRGEVATLREMLTDVAVFASSCQRVEREVLFAQRAARDVVSSLVEVGYQTILAAHARASSQATAADDSFKVPKPGYYTECNGGVCTHRECKPGDEAQYPSCTK